MKIVYLHMHALTYTVTLCRAFDIDKNIVTQKISSTKILQSKLMQITVQVFGHSADAIQGGRSSPQAVDSV